MSSEDLSNVLKQMIVDDLGERVRILIDRGSKELEDRKNMSDNARDTQFQGFAKLLVGELFNDDVLGDYGFIGGRERYADLDYDLNICELLIARRAYDLVNHAIGEFIPRSEDSSEEYVKRIPDMTELPKEQNNGR
jgi:hypothetical protein